MSIINYNILTDDVYDFIRKIEKDNNDLNLYVDKSNGRIKENVNNNIVYLSLMGQSLYLTPSTYHDSTIYSTIEHHVGRFSSLKKCLKYLKDNNINGDILEYGVWKGHSLYNMLYFMEKLNIKNKKIIGLDGFIGIPMEQEHKNQAGGMFSDTSVQLVESNIKKFKNFYPSQMNNWAILKALYKEKDKIRNYFNSNNINLVSLVHLDCDVYPACEEALSLLFEMELLNDIWFLHFDDWKLGTEIPEWFSKFTIPIKEKWNIEELFETRFTKTFKFTKK